MTTSQDCKITINSVFIPDYMAPYFAERKRAKVRKPDAFLELVRLGMNHITGRGDSLEKVALMMTDLAFHNKGTEVTLDNVYKDEKPSPEHLSWPEVRALMSHVNGWLEKNGQPERVHYLLTFMVNVARLGYEVHMMK